MKIEECGWYRMRGGGLAIVVAIYGGTAFGIRQSVAKSPGDFTHPYAHDWDTEGRSDDTELGSDIVGKWEGPTPSIDGLKIWQG